MPRNLEPSSVAFHQRLKRGALVVLPQQPDAQTQALRFQYNPETLTRTRAGQFEHRRGNAPTPQQRTTVDAQRRGGLHVESEMMSIKLVFDATETLLRGDVESQRGVLPELALLEGMSRSREPAQEEQGDGAITSVNPPELLLVLGERSFPVVITSSTLTEQRYSPDLVPLRAEVDLRLRVLEVTEAAANSRVAQAFEQLRQQREAQARYAEVTGTVEQVVQQALQPVEHQPPEES